MSDPQRIGRYAVRGEVARGGMGAVFRAWDGELRREVAIKLLLAGRDASNAQRTRFAREASSLGRLQHPNVMPVHEAGEHEGAPYLVMPLVEGRTLQDRLDREGPLEPSEAANLTRLIAGAVAHCHAAGVLHRDLKPENVILVSDGEPLLTDFGLARDVDVSLSGTRLSSDGQFLGTPAYWSPEQARGELRSIGPHTDVFGLGALLYALLTGTPPFDAGTLVQLLEQAGRPVVAPSRRRRGIPRALEQIVLRCMALDPERRYPSAAAVEEALADWEQGASGRRGPALILAGACAAACVALAATVFSGGATRPGSSTSPAEASPVEVAPVGSPSEASPKDSPPAEEGPVVPEAVVIEGRSAKELGAEALIRWERGEFQAADHLVQAAFVLEPGQREATLARCRLLLEWRDVPRAFELARKLSNVLGRKDPEVLEVLALSAAALDQRSTAGSAANTLIALDLEDSEHYLVRARVHLLFRDFQAASEDLERARGLGLGRKVRAEALGLQAQVLNARASELDRERDEARAARDEARDLGRLALEQDPDSVEAYWALTQVYYAGLQWKELDALLDEQARRRPFDPVIRIRRAWGLAWRGQPEAALAYYAKALELWPGYPIALSQRSSMHRLLYENSKDEASEEAQGHLRSSLRDMEQAKASGPRCLAVHTVDAQQRRREKDFVGEEAALTRGLAIFPQRKRLLFRRAVLRRERLDDIEGSLQDLDAALVEEEDDPQLHFQRCKTLYKAKRFEEALRSAVQATRKGSNPLHIVWRGICRYRLGRLNLARADVRKPIPALGPKYKPLAYLHLGRVDDALGRPALALESYKVFLKNPGIHTAQVEVTQKRVAELEAKLRAAEDATR